MLKLNIFQCMDKYYKKITNVKLVLLLISMLGYSRQSICIVDVKLCYDKKYIFFRGS
jgi:hypothetical protein